MNSPRNSFAQSAGRITCATPCSNAVALPNLLFAFVDQLR